MPAQRVCRDRSPQESECRFSTLKTQVFTYVAPGPCTSCATHLHNSLALCYKRKRSTVCLRVSAAPPQTCLLHARRTHAMQAVRRQPALAWLPQKDARPPATPSTHGAWAGWCALNVCQGIQPCGCSLTQSVCGAESRGRNGGVLPLDVLARKSNACVWLSGRSERASDDTALPRDAPQACSMDGGEFGGGARLCPRWPAGAGRACCAWSPPPPAWAPASSAAPPPAWSTRATRHAPLPLYPTPTLPQHSMLATSALT